MTPSEVVADRAAKSFRDLVQTKMVMQERYKIRKLVYGAGMILLILALIAGISVFNNYDRMKAVQMAMEAMSDTVHAEDVKKEKPKEKSPKKEEEKEVKEKKETKGKKEKSEGTYTVEPGDTLAGISKKAYGDFSHVEAISKKNGLENGNLIYVGQKLVLP